MNACNFCGCARHECECRERAQAACQNIFSGIASQMGAGFRTISALDKRFSKAEWAEMLHQARSDRAKERGSRISGL